MPMLRNLRHDYQHLAMDNRIDGITSFLEEYLHGGRIAYMKLFEYLSRQSDLVIDGSMSTDAMAKVVIEQLIGRGIIVEQTR